MTISTDRPSRWRMSRERKAALLTPAVMALFMSFMMSGLLTAVNLGLTADFLALWMRAFLVAWPAATAAVYVSLPLARRVTLRLLGLGEAPSAR